MMRFQLDLQEFEELPTNKLPGFVDALLAALPGLASHGCSARAEGGFARRLTDGTWIGHVIEHVALELQALAGSAVSRGKTRSVRGEPGVYNVLVGYREEAVGLAACRMAVDLVAGLLDTTVTNTHLLGDAPAPAPADGDIPGLTNLRKLAVRSGLGPTTRSIVDEAERRGIRWERLDEYSLVRFGMGANQRVIRASITGATSHLGVEAAGNKALAKSMLAAAAIPVPRGSVVTSAEEAVAAASKLPSKVVVKPLDGNHGRGVSLDLDNDAAVREAFAVAAQISPRVIVEEQYSGRDYRILVINGRVVAVAEREPAHVTGDGELTVRQLIERLNSDPRRGAGHENVMTRVVVNARVQALLREQEIGLDDVAEEGRVIVLSQTANISTGGEAIDRTDEIHPENRAMAERAARVIGLDVAGLDVLAPDIREPLSQTGGGIVEVNAAPGFRMHLQPSSGEARNVAAPVIDALYPRGSRSRIPVTSITGTNGKSTTVRMLGHILQWAGVTVGLTTTTGVYIGGQLIRQSDASGPKSARLVLGDPSVEAAVLETARGGILREGLAYNRADVGVVLNVTADHLGLKGIDTLEDLARVKSVVARRVRRNGVTVLNFDDPLVRRMARVAGGRVAWFTSGALTGELDEHLANGGIVAALEDDGLLVIHDGAKRIPLLHALDIPATFAGAAIVNSQNALVAAVAAYVQGISPVLISEALRSFHGSYDQNPGRLNITQSPGFTTIVDYAHNPAALRALGDAIDRMRPLYDRVIGVVSIPGDRRDEDIHEMGVIAAGIFDELVFRERPDGRGRAAGGVMSLLSEGAHEAGMREEHMRRIMDEYEAVEAALRLARPNDLVVMMPTNVAAVWEHVQSFVPAETPAPSDARESVHG